MVNAQNAAHSIYSQAVTVTAQFSMKHMRTQNIKYIKDKMDMVRVSEYK